MSPASPTEAAAGAKTRVRKIGRERITSPGTTRLDGLRLPDEEIRQRGQVRKRSTDGEGVVRDTERRFRC
ncbi:hypothetical protein GCM10027259_00140 [Micromonospora palomenae]